MTSELKGERKVGWQNWTKGREGTGRKGGGVAIPKMDQTSSVYGPQDRLMVHRVVRH